MQDLLSHAPVEPPAAALGNPWQLVRTRYISPALLDEPNFHLRLDDANLQVCTQFNPQFRNPKLRPPSSHRVQGD